MANTLRSNLEALHSTVLEKAAFKATPLLNDIRIICLGSLAESEIGFCASLLFKGPDSLLVFFGEAAQLKEFSKCRENCFLLLQDVVDKMGQAVKPYAEVIIRTCTKAFRSERLSTNKEKLLGIIVMLIELGGINSKTVDVGNLRKICNEELGKRSGTTSTVKGRCFHLLGIIAQYYPEHMVDHSERLYDVYLREIKREFEKTSDMKLIEGCLKGLSCLMVNFSKGFDEDPETCNEIFKFTIMSIQPKTQLGRYAIPTAGLQILQRHASQFGRLLCEQYELVYTGIQKWFNHTNTQMKHEAHMATSSFLEQIVRAVNEDVSQDRAKKIFLYFMSKFKDTLEATDANSKAVSIAIQGYGVFARLCKRYMLPTDVSKMLSVMMDKCERMYLRQERENNDNQLHQLPSFLSSLANIINEMMEKPQECAENVTMVDRNSFFTESFQRSLCCLCVLMIKEYPRLNEKFHKTCCRSLISVMHAFSSSPDCQNELITKIVYQGLIRCCLHQASFRYRNDSAFTSLDDESIHDVVEDSRSPTHTDYLSLWKGLICPSEHQSISLSYGTHLNTAEHKNTRGRVFDKLFSSIISVVHKLNLSSKDIIAGSTESESGEVSNDELIAENVVDLQLFVNLTELCQILLPTIMKTEAAREITEHIFQSRASFMIKELIKRATRFPMVSGLYKLIATMMEMCVATSHFSPTCMDRGDSEIGATVSKLTADRNTSAQFKEIAQCKLLIEKFVLEVASYLSQWKDDLLISSIVFILSLPLEIAEDILEVLVHPLQAAFRLGLSYTPMAEAGMNAMERWMDSRCISFPEPLLAVLPDMEPFLHVASKKELPRVNATAYRRRRSKIHTPNVVLDSPALEKVRVRVMRMFGRIGGLSHACLDRGDGWGSDESDSAAIWDKNATVEYSIPFQELKLDLQLELLLPRVTELASQTANRQTKVTACELLHSMTVYIIGKSAQQDAAIPQQNTVTGIYECIFPVILKLACDIELVCKQLFEPLVMQMIHWFTNNKKYESPDTVVLLNSIMNGLVDETDGALRELCARSVEEFLLWSIKQDTGTGDTARKNAKSLFKRLRGLARHPSKGKRLGSATAFNQIYRIFREQNTLVSEFTFELMATYIDSLSMAHDDDEASGTKKACSEVLNHIQRIVVAKKDVFNSESKDRRIPGGFPQNKPVTLPYVVEWLLEQCGRPRTESRHSCIELLSAFIPLLDGNPSPGQWTKALLSANESERIISCFEGGTCRTGIALYPQMMMDIKETEIKSASHWFDLVVASLECYGWVLQQKLLTPLDLFQGERSNLFRSIDYFLHDVARCEIHEILRQSDVYSQKECDAFREQKCTLTVRILQFFTMMLLQYEQQCPQIFPKSIWEEEALFGVVADCVVNPHTLGFNVEADIRIAENFPPLVADLVMAMYKGLKQDLKEIFLSVMTKKLLKTGTLVENLPSFFDRPQDGVECSQLISAYRILTKCNILPTMLQESEVGDGKSLAKKILTYVFDSLVKRDDCHLLTLNVVKQRSVHLGKQLIELALEIGVPEVLVVELTTDDTIVCNEAGEELATSHGQLFFTTYKSTLCKEICHKSSSYVPLLTQKGKDMTVALILGEVLEELFQDKQLRKRWSSDVCRSIFKEWNRKLARPWKHDDSSAESRSVDLSIFIKVISLDATVCKDIKHSEYFVTFEIFTKFITYPDFPLSLKAQALTLLSFFCVAEDVKRQDQLRTSLAELCSLHFPSRSSEFLPGTSQFQDYVTTIKRLLLGLELTGNIAILEVLISVLCREENHIHEDDFHHALQRCLQNVNDRQQKLLMDVPYRLFSDPTNPHPGVVKGRIVHNVLVPLITSCSKNAAQEFYICHIGPIMHSLLEDHKKHSKEDWKSQLAMKSCFYKLTELMFRSLPPEEFKIDSSPLVQSFASSNVGAGSTKLLKTFMGRVIRDKNEDFTREDDLIEEKRKFHSAVYNAVIAAVICTQTEIKWYDAFIFSDNPKKREYLFDNIIDKNKKYTFPVRTDEPLEKRKKIISIRQTHRESIKRHQSEYQSIAYASSLIGSSLSEEVERFDNNSSVVVQHGEHPAHSSVADLAQEINSTAAIVELERDEINDHECMSNLVLLVTHMREKSIGSPKTDENSMEVDQETSPPNLPKWMGNLIQKINSTTHLNVKIFITKLLVNCEDIFRPFASYFLAPIMKVILMYFKNKSDVGDSGMDQFTVDALVMLLSWSPTAIPKDDVEDKILVRAVLEALMRNIKHEDRGIFRRNLNLLKTALECWKKRIPDVNTDIVFHLCNSTDPKSLDNFPALQLFGALLANGFPPYTPSIEVDRDHYFQRIFTNMHSSRKDIVDNTAEVMGMSLKHLAQHQNEVEGGVHDIANRTLEKLSSSSKAAVSGLGVFITSLHRVAKHYSPSAEPFIGRVLFNLPKLPGAELKSCCIDILSLCIGKIDNVLAELKAKDFISMLIHRDDSLQHSCLKLCAALLRKTSIWEKGGRVFNPTDVESHQQHIDFFFPTVEKHFRFHPSSLCRQEMYNLAMEIYDLQRRFPTELQSEMTLKTAVLILVHGLSDQEEYLRTQVANFWSQEDHGQSVVRLATDPAGKVICLLQDLYHPAIEEVGYLSSSCNLIMQAASRSTDFERPIFDHPLSECVFKEVNVDHMWQSRSMASNPHFAETLRSAVALPSTSSSPEMDTKEKDRHNMLQATQQKLQFSATFADNVSGKNTYNWMTGNSIDTFASLSEVEQSLASKHEGSSPVSVMRKAKKIHRSRQKVGSDFGRRMDAGNEKAEELTLDLERLRRKFKKDSGDARYHFARVASRQKRQNERSIMRDAIRREHAVQMYRTYRIGELPDIEIPHRGLITPLTALAQHDPVFLRRFMSLVIHGITKQQITISENQDYVEKITNAFTRILTTSQQCNSTFVGCILDIILQSAPSISISPSVVSHAAVKAGQQHLGIRVIEQFLILEQEPKEPISKRRKLLPQPRTASDAEATAWVELARLDGKDFDTLRGIFTATPIARPLFSEAITFEMNGEFSHALKIYQNALLNEMDPEPSDVEKDLWEDCLLSCLKNLGRWKDVNDFCDKQVDNSLNDVWMQTNFQQRFLATSLHAKMLMLSRGDAEVRDELIDFLESAIKHGDDRKKLVESQYPYYIAMAYIHQKDYDQARYYLQKSAEAFAEKWSGIELRSDEQTNTLSKLFHLSDMMDFLDVAQKNQEGEEIMQLVEKWTKSSPHPMHDSVSVWEDMVTYRSFFIDNFNEGLSSGMEEESQNIETSTSLKISLARKKLSLILNVVDCACDQKHFAMARKFLNDDARPIIDMFKTVYRYSTEKLSQETMSLSVTTSRYYLALSHHLIAVGNKENDLVKSSKAVLHAYNTVKGELQNGTMDEMMYERAKLHTLLGQTFNLALEILSRSPGSSSPISTNLKSMLAPEDRTFNSECKLEDGLTKLGKEHFQKGAEILSRTDQSNENVAEGYLAFAKFCDEQLDKKENYSNSEDTSSDCENLAKDVIKYTLRTMKYHNCKVGAEASLKYPRLLQLIKSYQRDAKSCFMQELSELPTWLFLRWISQMVALLDKEEAPAIHNIVSRLASTYPQAVVYPIKTSYPDFVFSRNEIGKKNKTFAKKLLSDLDTRIPIVEKLIKNLTLLTSPAHVFKEWLDQAAQILRSKDQTGKSVKILTKYQIMYNDLFARGQGIFKTQDDEEILYGTTSTFQTMGSYRTGFANKFRNDVDKAFGGPTGGQALMDEKRFISVAAKISKSMDNYCVAHKPKTLKEYSMWLFDFDLLRLDREELEIPGQYKGTSKPMPEYHAKIAGFEDGIRVMSSLQQPKRITIKASDSRNYQYLVKGNEDLRQDQRIQQLFQAMNVILEQDHACSVRKMHINTYQVIPVTSRLGLIEWVGKTDTLQDIIYEEARRVNKSDCIEKAAQLYSEWMNKYAGGVADPRKVNLVYGNMVKRANYTQTCEIYHNVLSQIPKDLLRNAYLRLSSSSEMFLTLRKRFAVSYGTMCAAHWLLGIGDRHTSNCMISKKTGAAVGIDFGHAFGTATEVLGVPELVPFRLSPQLCYLMAPHPAKEGAIRQSMVFCFSALRSNQETILTMLDIFLKEPSVDWLKHANKMIRVHGSGVAYIESSGRQSNTDSASSHSNQRDDSRCNWYPLRKIETVRRKLTGYKPSEITIDELQHNYHISKMNLPHYKAIAAGVDGRCSRVGFGNRNLSVDDQVTCLIDQATDPNILGRTWKGWRFWL